MAGPAVNKSAVSWAFDGAVMAAGASVGLLAVVGMLARQGFDLRFCIALLAGAPVIAVMSRFPLVLNRATGGIEVGFESAVLVFLACYEDPASALVIWCVGQTLSQITRTKRPDIRVFNVGLGFLSGFVAVSTMLSISPLGEPTQKQLLAVGVGCAVYFIVDFLASAISLAIEDGTPIATELGRANVIAALGVFVAIDSLGYLAALVVRELPAYASALLAVPVVTILVAARALTRGNEHRRRLGALFEAARAAQAAQSTDELEDVLRTHGMAAVLNAGVVLGSDPPANKEIGALVRTGAEPLWLVAPAVRRARASIEADKAALDALATVAEEAFSRLRLVGVMGRLARHDSLTGLPNRVLFLDRVEQAVARSRRQGTQIAVLFLDLDGFKSINDRFGHAEGDELLKTVAARLLGCMRAVDSVARLGGDEFAVLVEGVNDLHEIELLCRRMLSALRRDTTIAGHDVVVGGSIGVALSVGDDDGPGLLRNADMAMYRAKALGKNRYFVYQPSLREANIKRLELIEALRSGVASDLVVHYQPVVDLERGRIDGLRGAGAVEPRRRSRAARCVHLCRRGERADHRAGRARARPARRRRAAARPRCGAIAQPRVQHVGPAAAGPPVRRPGPRRRRPAGRGRLPPRARDDREHRRGRRPRQRRGSAHAQAGRGIARDRRLRRRVLVHRLSPAPAGGHHQDRPQLHQ